MKIRFKKLHADATIPKRAHATDAGFDLTAVSRHFDQYGAVVYGTGIAVEIPEGHVGLVFPRSSLAKYDLALSNSVGVIDAGYRGEITAKFKPALQFNKEELFTIYEVGDRIAQLIILPIPEVEFEEVEELSDGERGTAGYGSTGA